MRSLPIAVLFSLVSLVASAAFSKRGHTLRNTRARSRCYAKSGGMQNQTDGIWGQLVDQYKGQDFLDEA